MSKEEITQLKQQLKEKSEEVDKLKKYIEKVGKHCYFVGTEYEKEADELLNKQ